MKKLSNIILSFLIILDIVWLLTYLFATPINLIDEGQFAAWANNMLHGKKMYKDIYITYGPAYVYMVYLWLQITHSSFQGIRIFLFAINSMVGIPVVYLLMRELKLRETTILLALSFIFLLIPSFSIRQAVGLLVIYIQAVLFRKSNNKLSFFLGALLAFSFLISPDIGIYAFISIALANLTACIFTKKLRNTIISFVCMILGLITVFLLFSIWASGEGWFVSYISVTKDVLLTLSGANSPIGQKYPAFFELFPKNPSILTFLQFFFSKLMLLYWIFAFNIIFIFAAVYYVFVGKITHVKKLFYLLFIFCLLISTTLIGRFGIGHVFFVLTPLVIILFYFMQSIYPSLEKNALRKQNILKIICLVIVGTFLFRFLLIYRPTYVKIFQFSSVLQHNNQLNRVGFASLSGQDAKNISGLQKYLEIDENKQASVFFLKDEPGYYMLVDRVNPTNYDLPFIADSIQKRYVLLAQLKSADNLRIVDDTSAWDVDGISNWERVPEIKNYILNEFKKCDIIGVIEIYCKK